MIFYKSSAQVCHKQSPSENHRAPERGGYPLYPKSRQSIPERNAALKPALHKKKNVQKHYRPTLKFGVLIQLDKHYTVYQNDKNRDHGQNRPYFEGNM